MAGYNTRRSGGFNPNNIPNIGQRRPAPNNQQHIGNNFVPGGQLTPNQSAQGGIRQPQQNQQQGNNQQFVQQPQLPNLRQQTQQFLNQQPQKPAQLQKPVQPQKPVQQQKPAQLQTPTLPQANVPNKIIAANIQPAASIQPATNSQPPAAVVPETVKVEGMEVQVIEDESDVRQKPRPNWVKKDGKINKKERLRRRNQRLRKILQPKNALMVLNELIGSTSYNVTETADIYDGTLFKCAIMIEGQEHIGNGKSKPAARTAAAEAALKHMVLSKMKNAPPPVELTPNTTLASEDSAADLSTDVTMKLEEDILNGISWSHVACYALHKLLSSWDEGSSLADKLVMSSAAGSVASMDTTKSYEKKPAKKIPETAATMNPIMLLNQMHPGAVYEEVCKIGNPPNVLFKIKCTVNDQVFIGTGSTKKGARKMCAFAACQKILGIEYTPEYLEEQGFNENAVTVVPGPV